MTTLTSGAVAAIFGRLPEAVSTSSMRHPANRKAVLAVALLWKRAQKFELCLRVGAEDIPQYLQDLMLDRGVGLRCGDDVELKEIVVVLYDLQLLDSGNCGQRLFHERHARDSAAIAADEEIRDSADDSFQQWGGAPASARAIR